MKTTLTRALLGAAIVLAAACGDQTPAPTSSAATPALSRAGIVGPKLDGHGFGFNGSASGFPTGVVSLTGGGSYDARRDYLDITIGTQSATTSFFSLDVPVRISGPVTDFSVSPAFGGSRRLTATGRLDELPPDMQAFAGANACAAG